MINIINRREVLITASDESRSEACELLKERGIPYQVKLNTRDDTLLMANVKSDAGSWENRIDMQNVYTIYVDKSHLAIAQELLRGFQSK